MTGGDFYGNEKSVTVAEGGDFRIELRGADGTVKVLKDKLTALAGEILERHLHERARPCATSTPTRSRTPRPRGCCCRSTSRRP